MSVKNIDLAQNRARMLRGELYYAFVPDLTAERRRCELACQAFNNAENVTRRERVQLWRAIINDDSPLPDPASTEEDDAQLLDSEPWIHPPVHIDYGTNVKMGPGVFVNFNLTILDTCTVTIGARTLIGPNVSFYSGTHPLDPAVRNGTSGPELGKDISVGEDCWIGGNVIVLPGVKIGRGCTIGAGSVVTKDVADFWVAAGNPARLLRKIDTPMDPENPSKRAAEQAFGAEQVMADHAKRSADREYDDEEQGW